MQDRALLDEETAWLLFGGTDNRAFSFKINGVPFVVAAGDESASLEDFATKSRVYRRHGDILAHMTGI